MLVLSRKADQQIMIGDDIQLTILKVKGNTVRIGIKAPDEIRIIRGELKETVEQFEKPASETTDRSLTVKISRSNETPGVRVFTDEAAGKNDSVQGPNAIERILGFAQHINDATIS